MTFYPQAYHPTSLDYIKVINKMGREARVKRDEPKTKKVAKPAKKRYSEHLKPPSVDTAYLTDGHITHPSPLDYAKPRDFQSLSDEEAIQVAVDAVHESRAEIK